MTGSSDEPPKPLTERERREARLAAALRTNLKRRKAPTPAKPPATREPDET